MKNLFIVFIISLFIASCSSKNHGGLSKDQYKAKIDSLENARTELFKSSSIPPKEQVLKSIHAFEFFAADYPDDEKAPEYLFEAAKRYEIDLQDFKNAIRLYKRVYEDYEDFEEHTMSLFHIGNAYHSMNDTTNAIATFKSFIKKYPNHDFADDAQGMIDFSRMGEKEFFKRVLEKNQTKDSVIE